MKSRAFSGAVICGLVGLSTDAFGQALLFQLPPDLGPKVSAEARRQRAAQRMPDLKTRAKAPKSLKAWFNELVSDRIDVTGQRVLSYHSHQVTGDREAFDTLTYYGQGDRSFTDSGNMTIVGKRVLGYLDFNMQVSDNRLQDPDQQRTTLVYDRGPLKMSLGDVNASLINSNRFAKLSRNLNGGVIGWQSGRFQMKALRSQAKGSARTVSIEGNNSVGPYYLQSGRIRPDTLEVQLDGQTQKLGVDYDLDSELGAITFIGRIIPPTSVIVATYESSNFNGTSGTIQGVGLAYDFGKIGRVGYTTMEQTGSGSSDARSKVELFQGRGSPSVPYDLSYEPIEGSVTLRVGSIIQVPGIDYRFDSSYPRRFFMTRYVDLNQTVTVSYRPKVVQSLDGDRRVTGWDYRVPFGNRGGNGYATYSYALGTPIGTSKVSTAPAKGLDLEYRIGGLLLRGGLRDVPSNFVSIESRGFNRNERAADLGVEYNSGPLNYTFSGTNSSIATRTSNSSTVLTTSRYTTTSGSVRYRDPDGTRWTIQHARTANRTTDDVRLNTTSLSGAKTLGRWTTDFGTDYQAGHGPISDGTTTTIGDLAIQSYRMGASWSASDKLSLNTRFSFSDITSLGKKGHGKDTSVGLNWKPSSHWNLTTSYVKSDSGSIATLGGLSSGAGIGYGGNGFSSGAVGDLLSSGSSDLDSIQATANYVANDRLTMSLRGYRTHSTGYLSANATTSAVGFGAEWDLGQFHLLSFSLDQSKTQFSDLGQTSSSATTYSIGFTGSPKGRLSYNGSVYGTISNGTGSNSAYRQNGLSFDTGLRYRLKDRQRLSFNYSLNRTTGYYGQNDSYFGLGYEYQIFRNVALRGIYRIRNLTNLDASVTSGSYRSRGLDFELTFDFAP